MFAHLNLSTTELVMKTKASAHRAVGKAKRAALRPRLVRWQFDRSYYAKIGRHAEWLPWPSRYPVDLLMTLRRNNIITVDGSPYYDAATVAAAHELAESLADVDPGASTVEASIEQHCSRPEVYRWGLADAQLDLAEWYIGLPAQYLGATIKLERADSVVADTRQWHRDVEDRRMLKLITYLSDVDDDAGPFGYLDRNASDRAVRNLQYWSGFISDTQLETVLPRDQWCAATGPALSTTFVDTCRLLHRATPPRATDRYSVTFSYSSRQPFQRFDEMLPTTDQVARLTEGMTERQQRAAAAAHRLI